MTFQRRLRICKVNLGETIAGYPQRFIGNIKVLV